MALGFMKNVFTFGRKQAAEENKPEDAIAPSEAEAVAAGEDAEAAPAEETPVAPETLAEAKSADPWDDDSIVGGVVGPGSKPQEEAEDEAEALPAAETHEAEPEPRPFPAEEPEETTPAEAASAETADAPKADSPAEPEKPAEAPEQPAIRNQGFEIVTGRKIEAPAPQPAKRQSWFQRLRAGLFRTSQQLSGQIAALFTKRKLDEDALEELEDLLIQADLGVETAMRITDTLSSERYGKDVSGNDVVRIMAGEITKVLTPVAKPLQLDLSHKPHVILVVGVNGTGKTTTIGKLAAKLTRAGLKVTLGAGDTFRAAAIEQLKIWSERTGAEFVGTKLGADAAGLAYDAFKRGQENGSDVVIIDTAGRLQNKAELMDELAKIVRVLGKLDPDAPHTVLQTLDATTGQNAMNQVEIFRNIAGVSGLVMTKLDGTARGGILVAIAAKHKLPVYFIGVGEGIDDLEPFEAAEFAEAIAGRQVEEQD
ncbi:MAG: signal recognition particle-docking protein FtsY [Martelella sp.]|uniref:signal recognition particle-docking protein FtsY n=1 Tax=Martelella sp. TaxID=1969699 RepID=UPI00324227E6